MNANDFLKTLDLTAVDDPSGSQVNQNVETATPSSDRGLVLTTTDSAADTPVVPDPSTYARFTRYLWLRLSYNGLTIPKLYAWESGISSDATYLKWVEISLTTAGLSSFLDTYLPVYFAAEGIDGGDINNNTIALSALAQQTTGVLGVSAVGTANVAMVAPSSDYQVLQRIVGGAVQFDFISGASLSNSAVTTNKIADNNVTNSKLPDGGISGVKLIDNTVDNSKLVDQGSLTAASYGSKAAIPVITVNSKGIITVAATAVNSISASYPIPSTTIPAAAGTVQFAHGLGSVPRVVDLRLLCGTTDLNHAVGAEVPILNFTAFNGSSVLPWLSIDIDSTYITLRRSDVNNLYIANATTGAYAAATPASWTIKGYAYL